jgi:carboxymethylenebutenolidase
MTPTPTELEIHTADGTARAWLHGAGRGRPGIVLYADAYGIRPVLQEMAARLAGLGYLVLLPDVFYRSLGFRPFDIATVWTDPPERERIRAHIGTLTPARVAADSGAYLDALAAQPDVRADRLGASGYCMGGRMAYLTAAFHPDRLRAAACFHAGGLVTDAPDSPHMLAGRVKAALYLGVADQDRSCTPEQQGTLAAALGAAGVDYALELYAGKRHGFAVRDNHAAWDASAEARHWRRMETFLGEALG